MKRLVFVLILLSVISSNCMVGPEYTRPSVPITETYKESLTNTQPLVDIWKVAQPNDQTRRGNWWEIFGDPLLNILEEQVTLDNQDLKTAEARFREARTTISINQSFQFPTISTSPGVASIRNSVNKPYTVSTMTTEDFVFPFDISYELDLWGRVRRTIAVSKNEAQATAADLEGVSLSLHSELALDYIELRTTEEQKRILDDTIKAYSKSLELTINRFKGGAAPKSDVAQAQTQLNIVIVQATEMLVQRAKYEHAIAVLVGKPPAAFSLPTVPLGFTLPVVPPGLPSQLLERRPDIAAAERRVAEANERIGIARAAFFPTVTLTGSAGFEGTSVTNWFSWPSRFWSIGPSLFQPLFDAGRNRSASDAALANYDMAVAQYRQITLTAFQQVEDNLSALHLIVLEGDQQQQASASAQESLELFKNRYKAGLDNFLQVVTAQTIALEMDRNNVDILRRRLEVSLLLIKALGGGWSISNLPKL